MTSKHPDQHTVVGGPIAETSTKLWAICQLIKEIIMIAEIEEIEKQFFKTFEIKPHTIYTPRTCACGCHDCKNCERYKQKFKQKYPQITDRILLELICIHNTYCRTHLYSLDYESLKKEILEDLINEQATRELKPYYAFDDMKQQVQEIFKKRYNESN